MYSTFIFSFLYSNSKIEYIKNDSFLHLRCLVSYFEYIIWVQNSSYTVWYFFFFLSYFFHLHTLTSIRWGPLRFHNIYEIATVFVFYENENTKRCFHFLYSNLTFKILKIKTEYKFLNQISFFWVPLKTKNENKKLGL